MPPQISHFDNSGTDCIVGNMTIETSGYNSTIPTLKTVGMNLGRSGLFVILFSSRPTGTSKVGSDKLCKM